MFRIHQAKSFIAKTCFSAILWLKRRSSSNQIGALLMNIKWDGLVKKYFFSIHDRPVFIHYPHSQKISNKKGLDLNARLHWSDEFGQQAFPHLNCPYIQESISGQKGGKTLL